MTFTFLLLAGLTVLVALALLLWPLLRRPGSTAMSAQTSDLQRRLSTLKQAHTDGLIDDEVFETRRKKLSDQVLELVDQSAPEPGRSKSAKITAVALAVAVPPLTLWLYTLVGEPRAISFSADARPPASAIAGDPAGTAAQAPDLAAAAEQLRERMEADSEDTEGWLLLARTYRELANFAGARDAYKRVLDERPDDNDVTVEYAESLGLSSNPRSLLGEPMRLLDKVLASDPQHQRALWLSGFARTQSGEYQQALDLWEPLLAMMTDPQAMDALSGQINVARAQLGMDPMPTTSAPLASSAAPAAAPSAAPPGDSAGAIVVQISLDPAIAEQASPDDVLFVFAKAESGPPMPLAVQRMTVSALPTIIQLDDSMGMVEGMVLSSFPRIQVEARVSKAGTAAAQPGDLQGTTGGLDNPTDGPVQVVINQVL